MSDKFGWDKAARKDAAKRGIKNEYAPRRKGRRSGGATKPGSEVFPFGKHKGQPLKHIPKSYLWWVLYHCQGLDTELVRNIIKVAGNGLKYARERGWAAQAMNQPDREQPPCPSEEKAEGVMEEQQETEPEPTEEEPEKIPWLNPNVRLIPGDPEERWEYVPAVSVDYRPPHEANPPRLSEIPFDGPYVGDDS